MGGGSGGGKGIANLDIEGESRIGGIGGPGGRWLAQKVNPADIGSTVAVTIGPGGNGQYQGNGNAAPDNGPNTSFGSHCTTGPGISASVADIVGYYSCEDSRPGFGGNGGGFVATTGLVGDSTPLAAGGSGGGAGGTSAKGSAG
jgi:hypothetical protein